MSKEIISNVNKVSCLIECVVFNLPKDVFYLIFGDYLYMSDIIRFESSLKKSKLQRTLFNEKLVGCPISMDYNKTLKLSQVQIMNWIEQRNVRYNSLKINRWNSPYLSEDMLKYFNDREKNKQTKLLIFYFKYF